MRQLKHPPRHEDLAQYMLESLAEQSNDPDYLAVIGPFSRDLPDAYRDRWQAREVVQRFHDRQENRKAGRWPPLEPMPDKNTAEPPELQTETPMTGHERRKYGSNDKPKADGE